MKRQLLPLVAIILLHAPLAAAEPALPSAVARNIDFQRDIQPILSQHCVNCHGAQKQRGGVRLDNNAAAMKGGNSGPILKPGDAAGSRLLVVAAGLDADMRMPPEPKPALTREQVAILRTWIDQGANWPQTTTAGAQQSKSGHWAFQPVRRPTPPTVKQPSWVRNDIDRFILARLEKEGIASSPEADRSALLRRLSLDLLGLPPPLEEVERFLNDTQAGAYERLVDRLLASPHYGERWARHWLDLARYADSDGYEKDTGRPFAWRYRHWVIDALNRDVPYDQLTLEQLAGDLLPGSATEQKVATGFHRNTLTNKEGGVDQEQFRVEQVIDRVNTTAKVFMGLTIGCAQCHDHKYDPFTHREYYQLFAFFNSDVEVNLPAPLPHQVAAEETARQGHQKKLTELQAALAEYQKTPKPQEEKKKELAKAIADHQKKAPTGSLAQTLALGKGRKTHILIRGDFLRPGIEVQADTPGVLPPLKRGSDPVNRLDLARWIVDPANPLTARVLANWVWHKYFGRGLVATLEDFGTQGEKPSHPELLDWLADEAVHQKWSLKSLHRLIVTSAAYRQSSQVRPDLAQRDPQNVLLARQSRQRLEAETLRDASLAASGLLTRTIGGPSVRPPQPPGISELTYAGSAKWVESTGADRFRRGLYIWFQRTSPYPMLMTFDAPDSNVCCVRRERSNTPLQALTLLNDTTFVECAQALGRRLAEEKSGVSERLTLAFHLCLARSPGGAESSRLARLYEDLYRLCQARPQEAARLAGKMPPGQDPAETAAWVAVARVLLNLDEFVTRE